MRSVIALVLVTCFGHGCAYLEPKSPVLVERDWGTGGAPTEGQAEALIQTIEETLARYRSLAGFESRPLRAHLVDTNPRENFAGLSVEPTFGRPWIVASAQSTRVERTVAHEMAHFYFDRMLAKLPIVVEEGVCEMLSSEIYPDETRIQIVLLAVISYVDELVIRVRGAQAKEWLSWLTQDVPSIPELLLQTDREYLHDELRTLNNTYGVGWMLAREIGYEGIVELSRRTEASGLDKAPPEWILEAAGLQPLTQSKLRHAFARAIGQPLRGPRQTLTITLSDS